MLKDTSIRDLWRRGCKSLVACILALFKNNKPAFTLAETLIVIGIIGVVAALTIPNLTQNTNDKEKVAKIMKVYSTLEDAYGRATATYGPVDTWFVNDTTEAAYSARFTNRMMDFLKVSKNCGTGTGCFTPGKNKLLDGTDWFELNSRPYYPKVILADGTSVSFFLDIPNCARELASSAVQADSLFLESCGNIYIDIDGPNKGSYTAGKDFFVFIITKTGIYPFGSKNDIFGYNDETLKTNCFTSGNYCAAWVVETGNMDYLKANKGVCPNGTTLTWTNTTCK